MSASTIRRVRGRRVWDSRGRPTVEAEIETACGARGRAIAPAGASRGSREAVDLRDGGAAHGGRDVRTAVANLDGPIAAALRGRPADDQAGLDAALIALDGTPDKSRLGGNATIAASMAAAHAAASAAGVPLWRYLAGGGSPVLPLPEIQIFGGGAHAAGRLDVQDFMVVCPAAASFAEALDWTAEIYRAAGELLDRAGLLAGVADEGGYWPCWETNEAALEMLLMAIERAGRRPVEEVGISLDIAASEFGAGGRYRLGREGRALDGEGMAGMLGDWCRRYPVVSIEDPLAEDDWRGLAAFTARFGDRLQIVGDDALTTDAGRIARAAAERVCNAVLIKPNQAGTLTETRAALDEARKAGYGTVASARSGESEDTTIVHLAVGWGVPQLKVGAFARSERMAKWNEALRLEEVPGARFAGAEGLERRPAAGP